MPFCSNMDGPRDYHTKWSKSEKEKHHMISLIPEIKKKWYKWLHLQNRNRLTNFENKFIIQRGKVVGGINEESGINICTPLYIK